MLYLVFKDLSVTQIQRQEFKEKPRKILEESVKNMRVKVYQYKVKLKEKELVAFISYRLITYPNKDTDN